MDTNIQGHKLLNRAIALAVAAHDGQKCWNGEPYILHPMRVMSKMDTVDEKIVAILHDVIEDTSETIASLVRQDVFDNAPHILYAIEMLTHTRPLSYMDYIIKLSGNHLAANVKIADLEDNMDIASMPTAEDIKLNRLQKYFLAYKYLKGD